MKRLKTALALLMALALIAGCSNASGYIKEHYPLVDVQGKGKDSARIYSAENTSVPDAAKEIAAEEKPDEISKENPDRMFLVYKDKIINLQKDPQNENNTLVEIDSIEYAKDHYSSSFLEGYLTASLLQSLFGGGWFNRGPPVEYKGYGSSPNYNGGTIAKSKESSDKSKSPATSERTGSFTSKSGSGSDSSVRKSDGSTPTYKKSGSLGKSSKPGTSSRSGSFTRKK